MPALLFAGGSQEQKAGAASGANGNWGNINWQQFKVKTLNVLITSMPVAEVYKKQIAAFDTEANVAETGQVLSVGDGIARIFGLQNVMSGELVEFPGSLMYYAEDDPRWETGALVRRFDPSRGPSGRLTDGS